jgi:hypothetical protein
MSGTKLNLNCLVWPNDNPNRRLQAVGVEIGNDKTVTALKKAIKGYYAPKLDKVSVEDLVLWMCLIPADDNLQETLNTIYFDLPDARLHLIAFLPSPRFPNIPRLIYLMKPSTSSLRYPCLVRIAPVSPIQRL